MDYKAHSPDSIGDEIKEAIHEVLRIKIHLQNKGLPDNADTWGIAADIHRNIILKQQTKLATDES